MVRVEARSSRLGQILNRGTDMETNLENYMPLSEISKFLVSTSNDPVTKWADDTAKIEFLIRILDSLRRDTKQQSYAIERITELLEVLQWKRCDLGRLLLHSGMVEPTFRINIPFHSTFCSPLRAALRSVPAPHSI